MNAGEFLVAGRPRVEHRSATGTEYGSHGLHDGMALDTLYSQRMGMVHLADARAVTRLLTRLGFRLWDDVLTSVGPDGRPAILRGLDEFREHLGGDLTVTLLRGIGRGQEVNEIDEPAMLEALQELHREVIGH